MNKWSNNRVNNDVIITIQVKLQGVPEFESSKAKIK